VAFLADLLEAFSCIERTYLQGGGRRLWPTAGRVPECQGILAPLSLSTTAGRCYAPSSHLFRRIRFEGIEHALLRKGVGGAQENSRRGCSALRSPSSSRERSRRRSCSSPARRAASSPSRDGRGASLTVGNACGPLLRRTRGGGGCSARASFSPESSCAGSVISESVTWLPSIPGVLSSGASSSNGASGP
jgi:hypothetical protein